MRIEGRRIIGAGVLATAVLVSGISPGGAQSLRGDLATVIDK